MSQSFDNRPTTLDPIKSWELSFLRRIPLTLLLACVLYWIGVRYMSYSGDGHYTEELVLKPWTVLFHMPLSILMHKAVYIVLKPWGWNAWFAVAASSALAGGIALQVYWALCRHPLFLAINIVSGSFLVFAGEVESYAWVNLFLLLTFLAVERFIHEQWRAWPALLFFFIACSFHMMAIFYLPPLFWILRKYPRLHAPEFLLPFSLFAAIYFLTNFGLESEGIDMDHTRLVPFFEINRKGQLFTFFTWEHLEIKLYFHWIASFFWGWIVLWREYDPTVDFIAWKKFLFFGIPLEWPALGFLWRWIRTPFHRYLLFCTLIGLLWNIAWHPDLGKLDWDLFSQMYIPFHVLLGLLAVEAWKGKWRAG